MITQHACGPWQGRGLCWQLNARGADASQVVTSWQAIARGQSDGNSGLMLVQN